MDKPAMATTDGDLMADVDYLSVLVKHTVPLATVPDGATAKAIRETAGVSRQLAGVVVGCGANTILRFEASQTKHSRLLPESVKYRALLAALMTFIARTNESGVQEIRKNWKPLAPKSPTTESESAA